MARKQSREQVRNLYQYKDLSDEDFDKMWNERVSIDEPRGDVEERAKEKLREFSEDYDLEDLKINDKEALSSLIRAIISLEDYEDMVYALRSQDLTNSSVQYLDRISKIMSDLRKDISKLQEDLNITRKIRKSDKESSVVSYIQSLKDQARQYYESRAAYIFCPECNMLLGTVWALYPEMNNKITLICDRTKDDGHKCGYKVEVTTKELMKTKGTNKPEVTPEALL